MKKIKQIKEEVANSMSSAGISGAGSAVNVGIAGRDKLLSAKPIRRFAGKAVFKVNSDSFHKARLGKKYRKHYKSYVSGDLGEEIRQYALDNPSEPIILEDETTGAMVYLKYGKK